MAMDKTIRRVTDTAKQDAENYRYWQSLSVGDRLTAVWDLSAAAYSFAESFNGEPSERGLRKYCKKVSSSKNS